MAMATMAGGTAGTSETTPIAAVQPAAVATCPHCGSCRVVRRELSATPESAGVPDSAVAAADTS